MNCQHIPTAEDKNDADGSGTRPENAKVAPGTLSAFQEKMDRWFDGVGYGARRGLICGLFTAWGLAVVLVFFLIAQAVLTHSFGKHDTDTFGEFLLKLLFFAVMPTFFIAPVGVIAGGFLGAVEVVRKKKRSPEPPSSASRP